MIIQNARAKNVDQKSLSTLSVYKKMGVPLLKKYLVLWGTNSNFWWVPLTPKKELGFNIGDT